MQNQQGNQFNYSSSGQTSSYTGTAPQYQAPGQTQNQPAVQNTGIPPTQPQGQVGTQAEATNPVAGAVNQQHHGPNFSQQVGVDAHGSLSSQFASRPPLPPPPPGQPPSNIAPPPGMTPSHVPNQYQGVSNVAHQPGIQAGSPYPSSGQPQWNQAQQIPGEYGQGTPGQGQHPGFGSQNPGSQNPGLAAGVQQTQGDFGQHPTGQSQPYPSAQQSQISSQVPTTGAQVPNPTHYNQSQQTNQFGQAVSAPPGITSPYASQPAGYQPNQQQTLPNPSQANTGGQSLTNPQSYQGQYQYQNTNQGQGYSHSTPSYQGQTQPQNQYTTSAHQSPVYSQAPAGSSNPAEMPGNSPYPTNTASQPLTSQAPQYNAYKPQAPVGYGGSEQLQQQTPSYNPSGNNSPNQFGNQYPGANPQQQQQPQPQQPQQGGIPYATQQQYGNQQQGSPYGGAPSR